MTYPKMVIRKIQNMRARGKTYREITSALKLTVPKSTLSYWTTHIPLPESYEKKVRHLNRLNLSKAQKMAWITNKNLQKERIDNVYKQNQNVLGFLKDKTVLKMLLAFLYLGEGSKRKAYRGLRLGNSDSDVIRLYIELLKRCYKIYPKTLRASIGYRVDQNLAQLQQYWSEISGIPLKNFYRSSPDPRTNGKPTKQKEYRGVCVISCAGADMQLELESIPKIILTGL